MLCFGKDPVPKGERESRFSLSLLARARQGWDLFDFGNNMDFYLFSQRQHMIKFMSFIACAFYFLMNKQKRCYMQTVMG